MRIVCRLLFSVALIISFESCQVCSCKQVPCPAFNDPEFMNWFPYAPDQKIVFRSNSLTDTITIGQLTKSEGYEANKGCYNSASGCNTDYQAYSVEAGTSFHTKFYFLYYGQKPFESSVTSKSITLRFYSFHCTASDVSSEGLQLRAGIYSSQYYPSVTVAGNVFSNVQVIVKDTSNSINKIAGPYRIYLAKNQGIVGYDEYPVLRTWVKQ
jgi:hypothetical protein